MPRSRLALIVDDGRLGQTLLTFLHSSSGLVFSRLTLDEARNHFDREQPALWLLVATTPTDADRVMRLVQEVVLQRLPIRLVLVDACPSCSPGRHLAALLPHVVGRFGWPKQSQELQQCVHQQAKRAPDLQQPIHETLEDTLARRLGLQTPSLIPLVERLALAAQHDVTVLLTGETGTGKTHLARLLHDLSPRAQAPFLAVPCGAIPANLVESTFFGHVRGAFTGATERKLGKFEAVGAGTLLLDEIDTLPLEQQAALLRVIETGEFEPVGSNQTKLSAARLIVASNWDLEEAVRTHRFREDLYYRLNVMSFHLPALRERPGDIAFLARGIVGRLTNRFKKELFDISPEVLQLLQSHPWPGNIRQLENTLQQAVLLASGHELLPQHLPPMVHDSCQAMRLRSASLGINGHEKLRDHREATERQTIERALAAHGYSRSRAAGALGISRVTLYKKMKKYGLLD
ncbi:MAG: sigma 54-interacting transcriptional regulator [Gemmataceae bacterium]